MSLNMDSYKTILKSNGPQEIKVKNSKFISYTYPIKSQEDFKRVYGNLKKEYHNSTHICYAYRLLKNNEEYFIYNDDGEPSGTAGLPILNEIRRKELYFLSVFVIRYYGGIKLGTGGLIRAYSESARKVIEVANIVEREVLKELIVEFDYANIGAVMSVINREKLTIIKNDFKGDKSLLKIQVPLNKYDNLVKSLINSLSGNINIK